MEEVVKAISVVVAILKVGKMQRTMRSRRRRNIVIRWQFTLLHFQFFGSCLHQAVGQWQPLHSLHRCLPWRRASPNLLIRRLRLLYLLPSPPQHLLQSVPHQIQQQRRNGNGTTSTQEPYSRSILLSSGELLRLSSTSTSRG